MPNLNKDHLTTVRRLISNAGLLNEEIREGVNPEYTRGQVELIADALGVPGDRHQEVWEEIAKASDSWYRSPKS